MEKEEWRPIPKYEGYYEISSLGRIRALPRKTVSKNGITMNWGYRAKKPSVGNHGYYTVGLYVNKVRKIEYLHRLIAEAFIPNPENKPCVDHINCNRLDNRIENLRWVTYSENSNNPITLQKISARQRITARERRKVARPIVQLTLDGEFVALHYCIKYAADAINGTASPISFACRHNPYHRSAFGYRWVYADEYYKRIKKQTK